MAKETFESLNRKLTKMQADLSDPKLKRHLRQVGAMAKRVAENTAKTDLGSDAQFSGWPGKLGTRYDTVAEGVLSFKPSSRLAAAKWTTLNDGRHQGNASGFSGPGINTRTGITSRNKSGELRKVRKRKAKRWNGRTAGKGTADRATTLIEKNADKMTRDFVRAATRPLT